MTKPTDYVERDEKAQRDRDEEAQRERDEKAAMALSLLLPIIHMRRITLPE